MMLHVYAFRGTLFGKWTMMLHVYDSRRTVFAKLVVVGMGVCDSRGTVFGKLAGELGIVMGV